MNDWQIMLAIGAAITALLSLHLPRAVLWIGAGAASFVASTAWARYGLPYPPAFAATTDAMVCILIYFLYKQRWEMGLYRLFLGSMLINITYLAMNWWVPSVDAHYSYVVALELINWAALALIGGSAILGWVGDHGIDPDSFLGRHLSVVKRQAYARRSHAPFTKVP